MNIRKISGSAMLAAAFAVLGAGPAHAQDGFDDGGSARRPLPLSQRLLAFDPETRANAILEIELAGSALPPTRAEAAVIETLWRAGSHEPAARALAALEATEVPLAVGIAWKAPRFLTAGLDGPDVRVGAPRTDLQRLQVDFDKRTGNVFALVQWNDGWTLNMSGDGGSTWSETYDWNATAGLADVDLSAVSGYVYIGYVPNAFSSEARIRRCFGRDGAVDSDYHFHTIVDVGTESIEEVALASNADDNDDRIYYAAIVSDHALRLWFSIATVGTTWAEADPGFTDAIRDLDMTWDHNWTCWHGRFLSYIDTAGRLHIVRHSGNTGWESLVRYLAPAPGHPPSISAFGDLVICVYRSGAGSIFARISYDCGDTWALEDLTFSLNNYDPDVTARGGRGVAVVFEQWNPAGIDKVVLRRRSGYGPGSWEPAEQVNEYDVILGRDLALDWLPPMGGAKTGYGLMYESEEHFPYFDRADDGDGCTGALAQSNFSVPPGLFGTTFGDGTTTDYKAAGFQMANDALLECATLSMHFGDGGLGTVSIWSGDTLPTTKIATLNSPPQDGVGDFTFLAPTPVPLAAGETYWLYVEAIEEPGGTFLWRGTDPNTLPSGAATHVDYIFNGAPSTTRNRFELTVGSVEPADINGDGVVNVVDLLALLGAWGPCPEPCPEDINGDGMVDVIDLLALLGAYS